MQRYVVLGVSHKYAPIEVRERVSWSERTIPSVLKKLRESVGMDEAVILSTCNRTEIYAFTSLENPKDQLLDFLAREHSLQASYLESHTYFHRGGKAVEHLLRVVGGLDSLVLGETQIVNQVKQAYLVAQSENTTGKALNSVFHEAFRVAKDLRNETGISEGQLSVSAIAIQFVRRVFQSLSNKTALLIGAGDVGELTLTYLRESGIGRIFVASRTLERARALADRFHGDAVPMDLLHDYLPKSDIVISQTSADEAILTKKDINKAQRRRNWESLFLIDLAVPRDIAPSVGKLDNVYLYNVDDLESVVADHVTARSQELEVCRELVETATRDFMQHFQTFEADPMIASLRRRADNIRETELRRISTRLEGLSEQQQELIQEFAHRLTNKLLHPPTQGLRDSARLDPARLPWLVEVLGLDGEQSELEASDIETEQEAKS